MTERSPVDLAEVVEHVLRLMAGAAAEAKVAVRSTTGAAPTSSDPVLLERLTQNLVENAIRHNLPADGWLSAETSTDRSALLVVCNSGPAVPKYEVETLFQPFRRLHGERIGRERSFGLGLSIVRAVATAHGGNVAAEPQPEGGLTVTVTLPLPPVPSADGDAPARAAR